MSKPCFPAVLSRLALSCTLLSVGLLASCAQSPVDNMLRPSEATESAAPSINISGSAEPVTPSVAPPPPVPVPAPNPPADANAGRSPASTEEDKQSRMPRFQWPPPKASAQVVIPDSYLRRDSRQPVLYSDVDTILRRALDRCGYNEWSYYEVPGGFAVVTRIEQTNAYGVPKADDTRWSLKSATINPFSDFSSYLQAFFHGNPGYYRVIVFVVTATPFRQSAQSVQETTAREWFNNGLNVLPLQMAQRSYDDRHHCTALVYEFRKTAQKATYIMPGTIPGKTHLIRSGIWGFLQPAATTQP